MQRVTDRLRDDPAVIDAAAATNMPGVDGYNREILAEAKSPTSDAALPIVNFAAVDDHFFSTYNIGLIKGRGFDTRDTATGTPVATSTSPSPRATPATAAFSVRRFVSIRPSPRGR